MARNLDQFVHRLFDAVAFGPHVADIHAAARRACLGQCDQFGRFGIGSGGIDHRCAQSQRAFVHRGAHQPLHAGQLLRRGIDIAFANLVHAHGGVANKTGHVGGDALFLQRGQILTQRRPGDGELDIVLPRRAEPFHFGIERPHRIAFAHDFQRHALADIALRAAVDQQAFGRPAQHVDEARRNRLALHITHRRALGYTRRRAALADGGDAVAVHRQPAGIGGGPRTIDDQAAGENQRFGPSPA